MKLLRNCTIAPEWCALVAGMAVLFTMALAVGAVVAPGPGWVDAGYLVVPVALETGPDDEVSALLFDLNYNPADYELVDVFNGESADLAGKDVQFAAQGLDSVRVLVSGFNQEALEPGAVALVYLKPLGAKGTADAVTLEGTQLTDPLGQPVALDAPEAPEAEDSPPADGDSAEFSPEAPGNGEAVAPDTTGAPVANGSSGGAGAGGASSAPGIGRLAGASNAPYDGTPTARDIALERRDARRPVSRGTSVGSAADAAREAVPGRSSVDGPPEPTRLALRVDRPVRATSDECLEWPMAVAGMPGGGPTVTFAVAVAALSALVFGGAWALRCMLFAPPRPGRRP